MSSLGGGDGEDTDHLAEITQLKEKIAMLQKTIGAKNNELVAKQAEMNQMRAKLHNEESTIREKMKNLQKVSDDRMADAQRKMNILQAENTREATQ